MTETANEAGSSTIFIDQSPFHRNPAGGLAFLMWRGGNMLFSPGQVSAKQLPGVSLGGFASHAEFESECARCHAPFAATQDQLCLVATHRLREKYPPVKAFTHISTRLTSAMAVILNTRDLDSILGQLPGQSSITVWLISAW